MRKLTPEEITRGMPGGGPPPHGAERMPVFGLLDNIRSLYNVGSMFRTSDGVLVRRLFLCGYTPVPPRKEIDKTALGATETVPWEHHRNPLDAVRRARAEGARIVVLERAEGALPHTSLTPADFPICLVVGNELTGVSPAVMAAADAALEIPMLGAKHSLNAAVAFGIAVYECLRVLRTDESGALRR